MDTVMVEGKRYRQANAVAACQGCAGFGNGDLCFELPNCPGIIFIEVTSNKMTDNINSPKHYTSGGIEAIDYIQAKLGDDGCISYCLGNVIKYVSRAGKKDIQKELEDLKKAQWYLNKAIEVSTKEIPNDY